VTRFTPGLLLEMQSMRAFLPVLRSCTARQTFAVCRMCSTAKILVNGNVDMSPEKPAGGDGSFSDGFGSVSPWAVFDAPEDAVVPEQEKKLLSVEAVAIPFSAAEEANVESHKDILEAYESHLQRRSSTHLGYPYNLTHKSEELNNFMKYSINNLGDPFEPSNYGVHSRQFEVAVIDFFAKLWKCDPDDYWGYVTTCGTEGNLHAMLLAREAHPNGIVYTSRDTHYSIFKAAKYFCMEAEGIDALPMGEIDYDKLEAALMRNKGRSAIINVNIGTTVKGAVDNLDRILRTLQRSGYERKDFHIHCDGALFAMMMPFVEWAPEISFQKPIDSIAVSGHKMLGCPMPCGVALTRKAHVKRVEQRIDYLNSVDTTIMGSRNGHAALHMWHSLRQKGIDGIKQEVKHCIDTACYLRDSMTKAGIRCRLNDLSCTVVFERPVSEVLVQRWQLACERDIAHIVVMPNVTEAKVDLFVRELTECIEEHGAQPVLDEDSPLAQLSSLAWGSETSAMKIPRK